MFSPILQGRSLSATVEAVQTLIRDDQAERPDYWQRVDVGLTSLAQDLEIADRHTEALWVRAVYNDWLVSGDSVDKVLGRMLYRADLGLDWRRVAYPAYKANRAARVW